MSDQENQVEQAKKLKDLSKECQKAVKQFKAFLKKHVAKDFSNVDVYFSNSNGDIYRETLVLEKGNFTIPKIFYDIHILDYKERTMSLWRAFCQTSLVSQEEEQIAYDLMEKESFYYLPKVKISIQNKRK